MACVMLANQFAVDLRKKIKAKVAGVEGAFEELLSNAKCEEAKLRDITPAGVSNTRKLASFTRGYNCLSNDRGVQSCAENQKHCSVAIPLDILQRIAQYKEELFM